MITIKQLKEYDKWYAKGKPKITDGSYDRLRDAAKKKWPNDPYFKLLSSRDAPGEKVKLPTLMLSLDKIRPSKIMDWATWDTEYLILPKLDGQAGKAQFKEGKLIKVFTRGDGEIGRNVTATAKHVNGVIPTIPKKISAEFNGEVVIHKSLFEQVKEKYKDKQGKDLYKASRNFVIGMLNSKEVNAELLKYLTFIVYSVDCSEIKFQHKLDQLNFAAKMGFITITNLGRWNEETYNNHQKRKTTKYPGYVNTAKLGKFHYNQSELSPKLASYLLTTWRDTVDIDQDGLVIEVGPTSLRKKLGVGNYATAIKPEIADHKSFNCKIDHLEWKISSRGLYKVTIVLNPKQANFNGVEVTRLTGHNAKAIKEAGIGKGSIIKVIRSGDVIPYWAGTVKATHEPLPSKCFHCGTQLKWTKTNTDLWCDNTNCTGFQTSRVVDFFRRFKVDQLGDSIIKKLIAKGYNTVPKIMTMPEEKLAKIDGLGIKSAKTIITNMRKKLSKVSLAEIMHASSMFSTESAGLGVRRAESVIQEIGEKGVLDKPITEALRKTLAIEIEGIGSILADQIYENLPAFREFYRQLPIGSLEKQVIKTGKIAVWSGYRDAEQEEMWKKKGGQIGGGVTKKTSVLFTATPSSTKTTKARNYGIKIVAKNDSWEFLKSM